MNDPIVRRLKQTAQDARDRYDAGLSVGIPKITVECADVDHLIAMVRERDEARSVSAHAILKRAVTWWLEEGMNHFEGAPEWVFAARRLENSDEQTRIEARPHGEQSATP